MAKNETVGPPLIPEEPVLSRKMEPSKVRWLGSGYEGVQCMGIIFEAGKTVEVEDPELIAAFKDHPSFEVI